MARVVWTREALAHVEAIRIYIGQFDPAAAQRLAARLIDAGNRLHAFPGRGRSVGDGFRQLALIRPYLIRNRVEQDTVYIVGIRHGADAVEGEPHENDRQLRQPLCPQGHRLPGVEGARL